MIPGKNLKDSIVFDVRAEIGSIRFLRFVGASPSYVRAVIVNYVKNSDLTISFWDSIVNKLRKYI